jgi:hypothetical protein
MSSHLRIVPSARIVAALLACATLFGCGKGADLESKAGAGGSGGSGGAVGPSSIAFQPGDALQLLPGAVGKLLVKAAPPGVYHVRFGLLGDFKDASLDQSEADTDPSGMVSLAVTAPSSATTFSLRASVGDSVSAQIGVSVSASGFATLQVSPNYTGKRTPSYWLASVRSGTTCAALSGQPLTDGDLTASQLFGNTPQIDGVPVGPALAVTLRGAYSLYGCLDVTDVLAGEINTVTVQIADLPMQLDDTDLELTLGLDDPQKTALPEVFDPSATVDAIGGDDVAALLDAMSGAASDQTAFDDARQSGGWDGLLDATHPPDALRSLVAPWVVAGLAALPASDTFRGRLRSSGKLPGHAFIELDTISGADVAKMGLGDMFLATWEADPDDTVLVGSTLHIMPSRLLAGLALAPALAEVPTASSVPDAVATLLSCDDVAASLVGAGSGNGDSFAGCDQQCTIELCQSAIVTLWQTVADSSSATGAPQASLSLTATGSSLVDDQARPTSFSGTWVGTLTLGTASTSVSGTATGTTPPPPG